LFDFLKINCVLTHDLLCLPALLSKNGEMTSPTIEAGALFFKAEKAQLMFVELAVDLLQNLSHDYTCSPARLRT
jgi:hypothetical protein